MGDEFLGTMLRAGREGGKGGGGGEYISVFCSFGCFTQGLTLSGVLSATMLFCCCFLLH